MAKNYLLKRKITFLILCLVAVLTVSIFAQPVTARADMGPKPSINVTLKNMGDELCFGTILSDERYQGPFCAYDPEQNNKDLSFYDSKYYQDGYVNEEAELSWQAFVDYEDADGYYFMQMWWKLGGENNQMRWGYHPPYSFKVLLYYPESNTFVTSEIYHRYAFDSYFTANVKNADGNVLTLSKSYDYLSEIVGLLCRIALTILIELLIALLFRMKGRKVMLTILVVNAITQIALNVALNLIYYFSGVLMYLLLYFFLELLVVIVEAVAYSILLRKCGVPIWKSVLYAVVANVATAVAGFFLAKWLPGMF